MQDPPLAKLPLPFLLGARRGAPSCILDTFRYRIRRQVLPSPVDENAELLAIVQRWRGPSKELEGERTAGKEARNCETKGQRVCRVREKSRAIWS